MQVMNAFLPVTQEVPTMFSLFKYSKIFATLPSRGWGGGSGVGDGGGGDGVVMMRDLLT